MGTRLKWKLRTSVLCILFGVVLEGFGFPTVTENVLYSIMDEHQSCDHIIPEFVKQVMKMSEMPTCHEQGQFPKPGNCTVFFKCVQSGKTIQPVVEYCFEGYNFVNGACFPNANSTDCPQYTCRIPSGELGKTENDIEPSKIKQHESTSLETASLAPSLSPSTTTPSQLSEEEISTTIDDQHISTTSKPVEVPEIHSEQLKQATQSQENAGSPTAFPGFLQFLCIILFVVQFTLM